jgi:hypothetical protein
MFNPPGSWGLNLPFLSANQQPKLLANQRPDLQFSPFFLFSKYFYIFEISLLDKQFNLRLKNFLGLTRKNP